MRLAESLDFYKRHAERYAEVSHLFRQSVYIESSHESLRSDSDLLNRLKVLAPGPRGLDAGCGAGARDTYTLYREGFDMYGIDAVPENLEVAAERHPGVAKCLRVVDLRKPLPFPDGYFDFVMCNGVIQHIPPEAATSVTLTELVRVLRPKGIFQLMFKNGEGVDMIFDADYGEERAFQLYDEAEILTTLEGCGCTLVEPSSSGDLGGLMYFTDPKHSSHCVFYVRKNGTPAAQFDRNGTSSHT